MSASVIIPEMPSLHSMSRSTARAEQEEVGTHALGAAEGTGDHVPLRVHGGLLGRDLAGVDSSCTTEWSTLTWSRWPLV